MRPRTAFALVAGALLLALALLALLTGPEAPGAGPGPRHGGRTLEAWLWDMDSPDPLLRNQAAAAVRAIGTNAIPTLTTWMARRDSERQRRFYEWLRSQRAPASLHRALRRDSEDVCEYKALLGFYSLGPIARPALPFLERLVREPDPGHPSKPHNAAHALACVDPAEARRLAAVWAASTNPALAAASDRLKGALALVAIDEKRRNGQ